MPRRPHLIRAWPLFLLFFSPLAANIVSGPLQGSLVLRRFVPEGEIMELEDLPEVHHMISERVESWTQQWLKQGMQQGMQQGKLEGKLEAEADMLRRLLIRRFGPLPSEVLAQINAASAQQIEAWFDRSVDASDLTQVFASH